MELGADEVPLADDCGDGPAMLGGGEAVRAVIGREAVREINIVPAAQTGAVLAHLQPAPAHVGHRQARPRFEPPNLAGDKPKAGRLVLLARLEQ
jgi:hypothetical protein